MRVSQQVLEWQAEARREGRDEGLKEGQVLALRTNVLHVLRQRGGLSR